MATIESGVSIVHYRLIGRLAAGGMGEERFSSAIFADSLNRSIGHSNERLSD